MQIVNFSEDVISFTNEFLTIHKTLKEVKKSYTKLFHINIFESTIYLNNSFYMLSQKIDIDKNFEIGISIPEKSFNKKTAINLLNVNNTLNNYNQFIKNFVANKKEIGTITKDVRSEILEYLESQISGCYDEHEYYIKLSFSENINLLEIGTNDYSEVNEIKAKINENYLTASIKMNLTYFYEILKLYDCEIKIFYCENKVIMINEIIIITEILELQSNDNLEIDFKQNKTEIKESKAKKPKKAKVMNLKQVIKVAPKKSKYFEPVEEIKEVLEVQNEVVEVTPEVEKIEIEPVTIIKKLSVPKQSKPVKKEIKNELSETVITPNFDLIDFIFKSCYNDLENLDFYNTDYTNNRLYLENCELSFNQIKDKIEVTELDVNCIITTHNIKDKRELLNLVRSRIKDAA